MEGSDIREAVAEQDWLPAESVSTASFLGDGVERIARAFRNLVLLVIVQTLLWYFSFPQETYILYQILARVAFFSLLFTVQCLALVTAFKLARHLRWRVPLLWAILLTSPFLSLLGILVFGWKVSDHCRLSRTPIGLAEFAKSVLKAGGLLAAIWLSYRMSEDFSPRFLSLLLLGLALSAGLVWILYGRWRLIVALWLLAVMAQFSPLDVRPKHWTGQPRVVPTLRGFPSTEAVLASYRGEVWLSGCTASPREAKWVITW